MFDPNIGCYEKFYSWLDVVIDKKKKRTTFGALSLQYLKTMLNLSKSYECEIC